MFAFRRQLQLPTPGEALPGRDQVMTVTNRHWVHGCPLLPVSYTHLTLPTSDLV